MEKILPSGAKMVVGPACFEDAIALHDGVLEAMKGVALPKDVQGLMDLEVGTVKDAILNAATSKTVRSAFFQCARTCTYNNRKIEAGLFDDHAILQHTRQDYYPMVWEVILANCGPFFVKTFSWLKELLPTTALSPGSK